MTAPTPEPPTEALAEDGYAPEDARKFYAKEFARLKDRVIAEVVLVTPESAAEWLKKNRGNRPLGEPTIRRYARIMLRREWEVNGEPVILDEKDNLLDAQHRLHAIVRVGFPVPLLVVYGVDASSFATLNTGKTRSLADVFGIKGEDHARALSSAVKLFYVHLKGMAPCYSPNTGFRPSHAELDGVLAEHPGLRESVAFVGRRAERLHKRNNPHPPGPLSFLHYVCHTRHPKEADDFFDRVLTGADLKKGTPEHVLSAWLMANVGIASTKRGLQKYLAIWLKAWAAFIEGRKLPESLTFRLNGPAREEFPKVA